MSVERIRETPRATKPFDDSEWRAIVAVGDQVDTRLEKQDVRLTMGGEPTFVSADDLIGEEWTTAANGEDKRRLAEELIWRLRARFAAGALVHTGQGKWYPGESLPRWALTCLWRPDGEPIWRDDRWLQRCDLEGTCQPEDANRFIEALARRLGIDPDFALEAYEDVAYFLWKENRLPVGVDPRDPKLADPEERARLARVFERGLTQPVGLVLPLERRGEGRERVWHSSLWMLRAKHLFLSPGESPIGLRLPLASLPPARPGAAHLFPPDPMAPRPALPPRPRLGKRRRQKTVTRVEAETLFQGHREQPEAAEGGPDETVHTALAVEVDDGRLSVFLPPTGNFDDYLDLIAAVEETAAELEMPVVVGGYLPPSDERVETLKITPDPGVIEVNVQPVSSWRQQVEQTTALYEQARATRLQAIKYLVDGREVGTGGGNHIVLGGPTPADSPFLRRPDLLRSLIGWWNNHPSLSYLFSSLFLGPTSQAPRMDEGRDDIVYEMELAFRELDRAADPAPPWLVDRIFRHLLVDVSGNTHRAEICIDKLYSPDSATGRLGLVEFRSFEMTPHPRMNLVQQLLMRAIIAHLWERPFKGSLIRWSTDLHDRFQMPWFLRQDLAELLAELRDNGFDLRDEWFEPQLEFRFPLLGEVSVGEVVMQLRPALEPWHVLGEEPGGGGTVRYVDSSVERLQVEVSGLVKERHGITCNGRWVPLQPTRQRGRFVAGVRFRAWQPSHCLHPTIGVHTPLVFDLVDLHAGRSLGGCTYHVGHPGGRSYEEPPVNALEAESRRRARFEPHGHTPGAMEVPREEPNPEFPMTLDLRRGNPDPRR